MQKLSYVDVHAHICHEKFQGQEDAVAQRAANAGLECVIVNGTDPKNNREVLEFCKRHDNMFPAVGLYPVDAIAKEIKDSGKWTHDFDSPEMFDVEKELQWIDSVASEVIAIGEIGLDFYWIQEFQSRQEDVFRSLIEIAINHDKPIIIHTRKAEERCFDILKEMKVKKADFHCYGGKIKLAEKIASEGYYFSIPPVIVRATSFQSLVKCIPVELLLTETDSPYMGPEKDAFNEPANVPVAVACMASILCMNEMALMEKIRSNYKTLFDA